VASPERRDAPAAAAEVAPSRKAPLPSPPVAARPSGKVVVPRPDAGFDCPAHAQLPRAWSHTPIDSARAGEPVDVRVRAPQMKGVAVSLFYRGAGEPGYARVSMARCGAEIVARVPAEATDGTSLSYFIEARRGGKTLVAHSGSAGEPNVVLLERPRPQRPARAPAATATATPSPAASRAPSTTAGESTSGGDGPVASAQPAPRAADAANGERAPATPVSPASPVSNDKPPGDDDEAAPLRVPLDDEPAPLSPAAGRKDTPAALDGESARGLGIAGKVGIGLGAGGLALVGAGVAGLVYAGQYAAAVQSDAAGSKRLFFNDPDPNRAPNDAQLQATGQLYNALGIAGLTVGGALAVTGAALLAYDRAHVRKARAPATHGGLASPRFTLAPVAGPAQLGVSLAGSF
jgi:hypothetical protein